MVGIFPGRIREYRGDAPAKGMVTPPRVTSARAGKLALHALALGTNAVRIPGYGAAPHVAVQLARVPRAVEVMASCAPPTGLARA